MAMEKLTLSTQLVNGILQYLGTQPYTQVAQLIQGIQQEAQAQATQPEKVEAEPVN
jgi:hypothetical protein